MLIKANFVITFLVIHLIPIFLFQNSQVLLPDKTTEEAAQ